MEGGVEMCPNCGASLITWLPWLVSAFLTNVCPGPQLVHAVECASSKVDHSQCCEKFGLVTFQGGRCLPFCRAHAVQPTNPFEFLPCLQVFELIKSCYRQYQTTHKNIFGD
ncbi:DB module [Trichostrongylus colubriformis]|uniref:DB module n=1 Tax=Trichostrongylus colubriformis TaxID=6319 RepID=A0AAN8FN84_TRICO